MRVLLVDDERAFREAAAAFVREAGYACDCAGDASEAIEALRREAYDVLVTDLVMAGNASLELNEYVATTHPDLPVVIVTGHPSISSAIRALRLSVTDYVLKPMEPEELTEAIGRAVEAGRNRRRLHDIGGRLSALAQELVADDGPVQVGARIGMSDLTSRERTVADGIAQGLRVEVLASSLGISERTVRNHLQSCFRKLGVHSQVELAARLHQRPR